MTEHERTATRVLVVGGWGRCGSTLLDMMLGEIDGFVSAGEVRELWLRGCVEDRPCGCGDAFSRCTFWSQVGKEAFGGWDQLDLETVLRVRYRWDRPWGLPALWRGNAARPLRRRDVASYVDTLGRLMAAVASVAGAEVVVDSSKLPTHTLLLAQNPSLDLSVVHLVRDSRGVAFSNMKHVVKRVTSGEPTLLPRYSALRSALRYDLYNVVNGALAARFGESWCRLRYEDLVEDPQDSLRRLAARAQGGVRHDLRFLDGNRLTVGDNHMVDGNPVRFTREAMTLAVDDEWRRQLAPRERRTMTALTWPLLRRYGYAGPTAPKAGRP
jgi:hypothetical protein